MNINAKYRLSQVRRSAQCKFVSRACAADEQEILSMPIDQVIRELGLFGLDPSPLVDELKQRVSNPDWVREGSNKGRQHKE